MRKLVAILLSLVATFTLWAQSSEPKGVANIVGTVTCQGEPVEGVVVSDGALFTRTDSLGFYSLNSLKYYGSVFIITPSGYEPTTKKGVIPQFWAPLDQKHLQKVDCTHKKMRVQQSQEPATRIASYIFLLIN